MKINSFSSMFYHSRCYFSLAHEETSPQDAQGSEKSCLHRSLASESRFIHGCSCWSEGIPSSYRNEQENLPHRTGYPHQGWKGDYSSIPLRHRLCGFSDKLYLYLRRDYDLWDISLAKINRSLIIVPDVKVFYDLDLPIKPQTLIQ